MKSLEASKNCFVEGSEAQKIGLKLRKIVRSYFPDSNESIVERARVKLALYSRNGLNHDHGFALPRVCLWR